MRRFALCLVFLAACGSDKKDDDDRVNDDGTLVGASGGTVVSNDGALALDIPAGALGENVRITITSLGTAGGDVGFEGKTAIASYLFEPEGLTFATPAVVTATLPNVGRLVGNDAKLPLVVALTYGNEVAEINARQQLKFDIDAASTTHVTELGHFSGIGYFSFDYGLEVTLEPVPPAVMVLGHEYNVGVRLKSDTSIVSTAFSIIYDDNSAGVIGYGGGSVPYTLANVASTDGLDNLVPASFYACLQVGKPTYSVVLSSGEVPVVIEPAQVMLGVATPGGGDDGPKAVRELWPAEGPPVYFRVEATRQIDCQSDTVVPAMGPPYSGLVQYQGWNYPSYNQPGLTAVVSDGGAEQTRFDGYVNMIQRFYGIQPSRMADGACRPFEATEIFDYPNDESIGLNSLLDPAFIPAAVHVGSGGNDAFVAKFVPEELVAPFNPFSVQGANIYAGLDFELDALPSVPPAGLPVHAPADAATPIITLPGIASGATSVLIEPNNTYVPTDGVTVSWQADTIDAEFMHVIVWGAGNTVAAYECYVQPSTQLLTISQDIIDDLVAQVEYSDSVAYEINVDVIMAKRREVSYQGRTLLGFTVRQETMNTYTCGESGSCHP